MTSEAVEPRLFAVPPRQLVDALGHRDVQRLLDEMCERHEGELSLSGITERLIRRDWIMWLVVADGIEAVLATELYRDVGGDKRCRIPFCTGGGAKRWVRLLSQIEDWARSEGCARIDMIARKGWARHLPDYKMTHVVLEKSL